MYAVIESGSKQYRVAEGDVIRVESLALAKGDKVELERVLMIADDGGVTVGTPTVSGARVVATVQGHGRMPKVIVYKHRRNFHKKQGHRQNYTSLRIEQIAR